MNPGHQRGTITQADLRRAFSLWSEIRRLTAELDGMYETFQTQLRDGATIEDGPHSIETTVKRRGARRVERIKVI